MTFLGSLCFALTVNLGRIALWVIQPLILYVLYLILRARHLRIKAATEESRQALKIAGDVLESARFDPEKALGPETGHFGLSAMRERATRSGFAFAFRERDGLFGLEMERKD